MSEPANPLGPFSTYQIKHVLAAFKDTTVAESAKLGRDCGDVGDQVKGSPNSVVIMNEYTSDRFLIPTMVWDWSKYGIHNKNTTNMYGFIKLADRTGGQFVTWLQKRVVSKLDSSLFHLTFALKTYFIGTNRKGEVPREEIIHGTPLFFNVVNIQDDMNVAGMGTACTLDFIGCYNTSAQMPMYKPYEVTLTHRDGGLANSAPEVTGKTSVGGSIPSRADEDSSNISARRERLNKTKLMKNLKEVFEALEFELNQQVTPHKRQVQEWLKLIRNDYNTKIDPPPKQERGDKLPLKFKIELDPIYNSYSVDNRNLPFEQVEELNETPGISSITFRLGTTMYDIIDQIMILSQAIGEDKKKIPAKGYKVNISYLIKSENIELNIKIKQITLPYNTSSINTGPGLGNPLTFRYKSGDLKDGDITYFKGNISSAVGIKALEEGELSPVFGNREVLTAERIPKNAGGEEYFKSMYSGLRTPASVYMANGMENSNAYASTKATQMQSSEHEIEIHGNPHLMFDLQRKPSDVIPVNATTSYKLYPEPEVEPMYLKINIQLNEDSVIGEEIKKLDIDPHYFENSYYEICGVKNAIIGGRLLQHMYLSKTDSLI